MQQFVTAQNSTLPQMENRENIFIPVKEEIQKGFSFLDFLVIISALFVVGFLGYLFINPDKEGSDTRNIRRTADISSLLTSIYSYVQETGEVPTEIPTSDECVKVGHEICKAGPYDCTGLVNLSEMSEGEDIQQIISLPIDPENKTINGTGYFIAHDGAGQVTICAPYAERNISISFTKYVY